MNVISIGFIYNVIFETLSMLENEEDVANYCALIFNDVQNLRKMKIKR